MDDGWPGEGVFPHAVAYCTGVRVFARGFGGGTGDGGGTGMHHIGNVSRRTGIDCLYQGWVKINGWGLHPRVCSYTAQA